MLNTLLFIHFVITALLITIILIQKTSTNGLSGLSGGGNMGLMSGRATTNFLTRTTVILAFLFLANAMLMANLAGRQFKTNDVLLEEAAPISNELPVAQ